MIKFELKTDEQWNSVTLNTSLLNNYPLFARGGDIVYNENARSIKGVAIRRILEDDMSWASSDANTALWTSNIVGGGTVDINTSSPGNMNFHARNLGDIAEVTSNVDIIGNATDTKCAIRSFSPNADLDMQ